ncbi:MerR family transcriptional regulator [Hymenobacter siberiensis]|uniref:MerR family transcriptional regulator n=1 Tax=Hymenobacter siberiensis TaxID=2848396 RepID=UPI001C1DE79B|nr:MerR family transcriptional regulator [Hymenobacter siberiensis]MBU6122212.1 MerR family transcriptional regulator [Hymenobacter siberiensis]
MGQFSISDLEQLSGIKAHTIRMWEQRYGLLHPVRTATNIRTYCDDDLRRLLNVTTLCGRGQRISQVARLTDAEISEAVLACCDDSHDYHRQVNDLLAAMLGFDEPRLDQLLSEASVRLGFENTMLRVAYPLLQRIGLMWLAGTVDLGQEHMLAHLLRQKLLAATDALPKIPTTARRWVLFLPGDELHELALLFMNYLLRARGQHTLYLGQNLPTVGLTNVNAAYRPYAVATVLTTQPERGRVAEYTRELRTLFPEAQLVLYGPLARQEGLELPANCVSPLLMTDFLALISAEATESEAA